MRSARMVIVDRGNGNKARDDALRALDALLPGHWQIVGDIPQKPILEAEPRGSTNSFDALVIGEKTISIVNIVNEPGRVRVRIGRPYEVDGEEVAWTTGKPSSLRDFNNEVHKLCLLLRDRLDVDPYRVAGKMIWVGASQIDHESSATREEVTDIAQFVELAVKRDERTMLGPLPRHQVEAIAEYFLSTQEEDEARSANPEGLSESAGDFLIAPGNARSGAGMAEHALLAPGRPATRKAMVRSASFDADDTPPASPAYRFDEWAEATDNFGPAREVKPVQANGSGARAAWLWLGGSGLFALGAATAALVLVVERPERPSAVAVVAERDAGTQAQDFGGVAPDMIVPEPIDYGPVEDFAPAPVPQADVAYGAAAPLPASPATAAHRISVARTQIAAAVTRKAARSPQPPKAKAARTKSAQPASGQILCILPDGGEVQMPRASCRAQSGLVYG